MMVVSLLLKGIPGQRFRRQHFLDWLSGHFSNLPAAYRSSNWISVILKFSNSQIFKLAPCYSSNTACYCPWRLDENRMFYF